MIQEQTSPTSTYARTWDTHMRAQGLLRESMRAREYTYARTGLTYVNTCAHVD